MQDRGLYKKVYIIMVPTETQTAYFLPCAHFAEVPEKLRKKVLDSIQKP